LAPLLPPCSYTTLFRSYHLYQDGTLEIECEAEADEDTIITLTNHTYFNLQADHTEPIYSHEVTMNSSRYLTLNEALIAEKVQGVDRKSTRLNSSHVSIS